MSNYNRVILMGRLTREVELRYTPSGTAVADIGLAINEKRKSGEEVTFIDVTVWDKTAELCSQYVGKGRSILIEGRIKMDEWNDKESGKKRTKLGVVADKVVFCGGRDDNQHQEQQQAPKTQYTTEQQKQMDTPIPQDDIPF